MSSQISPLSVRRIVWLLSLIHGIRGQPVRFVPQHEELEEGQFLSFLSISIVLVLLGGVFAGLTLGLMGQDEVYLKVISSSGSPHEQKLARRVLDLVSKGKHWLLVTLLLSNVITNETLPIVLDRCLGGGWQAVVSSTVLIVIFGEIIPQSVCVRYGLQIGAFFCPFVLCLMYLMYPVAYPIALLLDWILGEDHGVMYKKSGLKTLVTLHRTMGVDRLTKDEVTIISSVLDLKEKKVSEIMTPIENVFTMSADTILNDSTVEEIFNSGFSRVPIYLPGERTNFIGMLLVRVLISYDPEDCLPISHFPLATLPETSPSTSCLNILNYFQEGKSHMCVVSSEPGSSSGALGVLTLEDVIEELIGEEIVDESDIFVDIHQRIMREQPGPLSKRHITSYLHSLYTTTHRHSIDQSEENRPLLDDRLHADLSSKSPPHVLAAHAVAAHEKPVIPSNLASNPLKVTNPYVKIKDPAELGEHVKSPSLINRDGSPNYGGTSKSPRQRTEDLHHHPQGSTSPTFTEDLHMKEKHANAAQKAIEHTMITGESTQVTTTKQDVQPANDSEENFSELTGTSSEMNGFKPDGNSVELVAPQPERSPSVDGPETRMISSSYRSTRNGIVESVITVKGVPKTIIAPAKGWDESQEVFIDEGRNIHDEGTDYNGHDHRSSSVRPIKSRRGSMFSLFRHPSAAESSSSSRPRSRTHTSNSSGRVGPDGLGDDDAYSMKETATS